MPPKQPDSRLARQRLFYALAEPTRRDIVELLASNGQMTATGICENFTVSHPAISQHLKVLREANLLHVEKHAQQRLYKINTGAVQELEEWAKQIADLWNQRFEALDKVLAEEQLKEHTKKVRKNV